MSRELLLFAEIPFTALDVRYQTLPPPPALAGMVRMYWAFEISGLNGQEYVYRSLADGCAEIVFHYRSQFDDLTESDPVPPSFSHLHAQTQRFRRFVTSCDFGIFGAYLYPHALPILFGHSAASLTDQMPTLQEALGRAGTELEERIMLAPDNHCRATILSDFLLTRLDSNKGPNPSIEWAIRRLFQTNGQIPISKLTDQTGYSLRHLERHFHNFAGFTPKRLARVLRFQSATKARDMGLRSLTEIALDCGYYDQAHFIHDFRQFSGYTPSAYFHGRPEGIEYRET
ncbi:MAG: helix-turn-helix domain-containing protein [Bacteroidia bacterium]